MVGVWFPISMFIAIGFEHSVANMFILPAGIFSGPEDWLTLETATARIRVVIAAAIGQFDVFHHVKEQVSPH